MTKYKTLKGVYYSDRDNYKTEVFNRLNSTTTRHTKLQIHPFNSKNGVREKYAVEMFYQPILDIDILKDDIYEKSKEITYKMSKLPTVAEEQLFFKTLIFELQSTNDIEGIRSSKKEIGEAVTNVVRKSKAEDKRFIGLVRQYMNLWRGEFNAIQNVDEFRNIWNELVSEEEKEDIPDGKLFRTMPETIMDSDKIIHEGDPSEDTIIKDLSLLISEMNGHYLPAIEKCFIAHYFYEYVHPFYDGNGRTGRFIACSYLARKLDILTAVSLSSTIAKNKDYYYKSFVDMSNPYNHGDATMFILRMMTILHNGQKAIIHRLNEGIKLLDNANKMLHRYQLSDEVADILFILLQEHIFGNYAPKISDKEMAEMMSLSRYLFDNRMNILEQKGLVDTIGQRPKIHILAKSLRDKVAQLH